METELGPAADRARHGCSGMVLRQMANVLSAPPILFGTDGVRGVAGKYPLEKSLIRKLGAAAAAVVRDQVSSRAAVFLLGRDTRGSGTWIARAFAEGALTQGVRLRDAG